MARRRRLDGAADEARTNRPRRLKIGYNRAARLIEQMERDGVVSTPEHNGNRTVLAPPPPKD